MNLLSRILAWRSKRLDELRAAWGHRKTQSRHIEAIERFHLGQRDRGVPVLDDHTCRDLNLADVFAELDRTESALGQQVLYHRLHAGSVLADDLAAFERLVDAMSTDAPSRERTQLWLQSMRNQASLDLWTLTEPDVLPRTGWYRVFPVLTGVTLASIGMIPLFPPAVLLLLMSTIISIALRTTIASWLLVVAGPFRQIAPLLNVAERLATSLPRGLSPDVDRLHEDARTLTTLRRIASLAKRDSGAPGDLAGLAMEYLNLVLYLDGNALLFGRRELERHRHTLARVITTVGTVDAAIAVASWRAEHTGWSRPDFSASDLRVNGMWHPLIATPVANAVSLDAGSGLIVTGSNMSGKTTYLRTLGVTAVMAQTIHTSPATSYAAPVVLVRSSIGRDDSLAEGKSYYLAEAESVLACVTAAAQGTPCLFLFDELFRGTNLVERLAAGEAVLRALLSGSSPHFSIVATHDGELVDMLGDLYRPVHFDGRLDDGELHFNYQLQPGRATSRNAIALLQQLGAPATLIQQATARAAELDQKHG